MAVAESCCGINEALSQLMGCVHTAQLHVAALLYPAPPDLSQDQVNLTWYQMCMPKKPLIEDSAAPMCRCSIGKCVHKLRGNTNC